jgi:hypothetical protein
VKLWKVFYRVPFGNKIRVIQFNTCAESNLEAKAICNKFYAKSHEALSVEAVPSRGRVVLSADYDCEPTSEEWVKIRARKKT